MSDEDKIAELEKDNERLRRRVKLLEKRIKKLQTETQSLSEELDIADIKAAASILLPSEREKLCPTCGYELEEIELPVNKSLYLCKCGYRKTE